jgi:hypothetical protein
MKKKVWIGLDLSINSTGYCVLDEDSNIVTAGIFVPDKYPGFSRDKYPKSTLKKAKNVASKIKIMIDNIMNDYDVQKIVVEEINPGGGGIMAVKSLSIIHGLVMYDSMENIDLFEMISSSVWRSKAGVGVVIQRRRGTKESSTGFDHKKPIVDYVNRRYGTEFELTDNDICDAIGVALGWMLINGKLKK